jgi:hypothetical protein
MTPSGGRPAREAALAALFLLALTAISFAPVRPTNFGGSDEWLSISLVSRGILSFPYANRPLNLVWDLPAWWLFPDQLFGFLVFHALWIGLGGLLVFLVVRRLLPGAAPLAYLAGAFAIVWAPSDGTRLCSVHMMVYSGCTFGALLTLLLLLEGWQRRKPALLAAALAVATVAALSTEAVLAPLAVVPVILVVTGWREPRRLAVWTLVLLLGLAAGGLRAVLPLWTHPERVAYQAGLAAGGLHPLEMASRSLVQLRRHVAPVFEPEMGEGLWPIAPLAVIAFGLGFVALSWRAKRRTDEEPWAGATPGGLLVAAALGCLWALASYLPLVVATRRAMRTQFLSGPGVAVLLAAAAIGVASFLPKKARLTAAGLLGAWVVGIGVQRTVAFQKSWDDGWSAYPAQRRSLLELTAATPDLEPGTLVVLLQRHGAWPFDLTFRHAVRYLYEGRAVGHVVGADPLLYATRFEPRGIRSIPDPVLLRPWRERVLLYPYSSVVVLREDESGRLHLLESWPEDLPPLPADAAYSPRSRLREGARPRKCSILEP